MQKAATKLLIQGLFQAQSNFDERDSLQRQKG
jgi:hypothetical protein